MLKNFMRIVFLSVLSFVFIYAAEAKVVKKQLVEIEGTLESVKLPKAKIKISDSETYSVVLLTKKYWKKNKVASNNFEGKAVKAKGYKISKNVFKAISIEVEGKTYSFVKSKKVKK